jgi:hypothetical protein
MISQKGDLLPLEQITIKLTQKCKETFERLAAKEDRPLSNWVRWNLVNYVREKYGIELAEEKDMDA